MRLYKLLLIPLICSFPASLYANETEIKGFIGDYLAAFNKQNVELLTEMWTEKGVHIDRETGERTVGRAAIRADLEAVFEDGGTRLTGTADRVRMIRPDVARVDGRTSTSVRGADFEVLQFSAILVKNGAKWQIDSLEEMPTSQAPSARNALKEMQWLVGKWVDESRGSKIVSEVRWADGGAFLVRTFSSQNDGVAERLGTQLIGWDPRSQKIRSWMFNADGGFGDGVWSKSGDEWTVKSSQTLADGRAASGTYVITPAQDLLQIQLLGHEIEGEPIPTAAAVTVMRMPETTPDAEPEPKSTSEPKSQN